MLLRGFTEGLLRHFDLLPITVHEELILHACRRELLWVVRARPYFDFAHWFSSYSLTMLDAVVSQARLSMVAKLAYAFVVRLLAKAPNAVAPRFTSGIND